MYTPNNSCVYIYAFTGCQAGLFASGKYPVNATANDRQDAAEKADYFAQAFDTAWGTSGYSTADLLQIFNCSYGVWALGRSPIADPSGLTAGAYVSLVDALVLGVQAGTAQIVAEGVNPNGCGGGGGGGSSTAATVTSGQTYQVLTTDIVVRMDTSGGATATADLPLPAYIGEQHTFYWWAWGVGQTPPTINTTSNIHETNKMVPFTGQATSGAAGLVTTTTITTPGASFTLEWDGVEWVSV